MYMSADQMSERGLLCVIILRDVGFLLYICVSLCYVTAASRRLPAPIFTRDSIYAIAHICYRPSLCPSHGWIIQKRLKIGLWNFHRTVAPSLKFFESKFHPKILRGSPREGALNEGGVGKIGDFRPLSRHISETVQDRTNVAIGH